MPQDPRQCVVTKPISSAGPTEVDLQRTAELENFLVAAGLYESKEEAGKREEVLGKINQVVKEWVKQLTRQRGYSDQMVEDANAVIYTFGSYRLGAVQEYSMHKLEYPAIQSPPPTNFPAADAVLLTGADLEGCVC